MDSGNPPGVRRSPSGVQPEYVEECKVLALCVLSAIHHISNVCQPPQFSCLLIYTDNDNTVTIFNTLWCLPQYNDILISAANNLIKGNLNLCILHIPGELNYVADAISGGEFNIMQQHVPGLTISTFSPPRLPLGAAKKWYLPLYVPDSPSGKPGHMSASSESEPSPLDKLLITQLGKTMDPPWIPTSIS